MMETARELAMKSSSVSAVMVDAAEQLLKELGVKRLTRGLSNRDLLYEIIRVALDTMGKVSVSSDEQVARDEEEWMQYFERCVVIVRDVEVGRQLLKVGTESAEAFSVIIDAIAQHQGLVVPLRSYPGVTLFKKRRRQRVDKSSPSAATGLEEEEEE